MGSSRERSAAKHCLDFLIVVTIANLDFSDGLFLGVDQDCTHIGLPFLLRAVPPRSVIIATAPAGAHRACLARSGLRIRGGACRR
jgi:hypothetical protein